MNESTDLSRRIKAYVKFLGHRTYIRRPTDARFHRLDRIEWEEDCVLNLILSQAGIYTGCQSDLQFSLGGLENYRVYLSRIVVVVVVSE